MEQPDTAQKLNNDLNKEAPQPTDYQARFSMARKAAGVSLKSVAESAGVSFQAISQFERGRQSLTISVFLKACEALNLNTSFILHGTGPMFTPGGAPGPTKQAGRPAVRK